MTPLMDMLPLFQAVQATKQEDRTVLLPVVFGTKLTDGPLQSMEV